MTEERATQEIVKLPALIEATLEIPPYQRPYKWTSKNVLQLLDDIYENVVLQNKTYRIGSVIVHNDKDKHNIVDGQQRLTTITLLLKILDEKFEGLLLKREYKHRISQNNIISNHTAIEKWVGEKLATSELKGEFNARILQKCEFVLFTVFKQDEAFQLFDSQNARGLALEPYDLLKAFHLREMEFDREEDRTKCIERWEKSIDDNTLKSILGNHLFRIRKWSKNEKKYYFTKDEIDEFKGISLYKEQKYPYESALRMLDGFVENAQQDKFLRNFHIAQSFPFTITMPIINGKRFFEYVDYYILQREKLFDLDKEDSIKAENPDFVKFYEDFCHYYPHSGRSGDEKVRNLYENIMLAFIDKFGYVDYFEGFYKAFYKAAFFIRCEQKRISTETIINSEARNITRKINEVTNPNSLKEYQYKSYEIKATDFVKGIDIIKAFIKDEK